MYLFCPFRVHIRDNVYPFWRFRVHIRDNMYPFCHFWVHIGAWRMADRIDQGGLDTSSSPPCALLLFETVA